MSDAKDAIREVLGLASLQSVTDLLFAASDLPVGVLSNDGEVLITSGWQRVCTDFHRANEASLACCLASERAMREAARPGVPRPSHCDGGFAALSLPIVVDGERLATLSFGQFFFEGEEPDDATLIAQARRWGFDEQAYIEAAREVPVVPRAQVERTLGIYSGLVNVLAQLGVARQRERDARSALARSEAQLAAALSVARMGYWECDIGATRCIFGDQYCRLHGASADELVGTDGGLDGFLNEWVHPEDVPRLRDAVVQAKRGAANDRGPRLEIRIRHKDGSARWLAVWFRLETDAEGRPVRLHAVNQDISARKKAEEERVALERRLLRAQQLESLGVLAGGVAHDFNNLLTAIAGNVNLAAAELPPQSPALEALGEAEDAVSRATHLTRQMLAYSGQGHFVLQQVDLSALVGENASLIRSSAGHNVTFELDLAGGLPAVEADPTQLMQVVVNLVTNASEGIGDGPGAVTVRTGLGDFDEAALAANRVDPAPPPGRFAYVEVVDTGSGMDADVQRRVFEPFFSTRFVGRGLGMPAVLGIVRAHRGGLLIESAPGAGTTVRALFPCPPEASESADAPGQRPSVVEPVGGDGAPSRVLIVDDERVVRRVCGRMVQRLGYEVIEAEDGVSALEVFREHRDEILCVILDLTMPRMGGFDTLVALKRLRPDVRVFLTSGFDEQQAAGRMKGTPFDGFIQKPFRMRDLQTYLSSLSPAR